MLMSKCDFRCFSSCIFASQGQRQHLAKKLFYKTISSDRAIRLDKRYSMSIYIQYNSTGTFNYACITRLYRCSLVIMLIVNQTTLRVIVTNFAPQNETLPQITSELNNEWSEKDEGMERSLNTSLQIYDHMSSDDNPTC